MSDLLSVLPDFPLTPQTHNIVLSLEKHDITTSDLLTLEQLDISKRTSISLLDLRRFIKEVAKALHSSIRSAYDTRERGNRTADLDYGSVLLGTTAFDVWKSQVYISTGDSEFDRALNGGIMTGGLTEIVGERCSQPLLSVAFDSINNPTAALVKHKFSYSYAVQFSYHVPSAAYRRRQFTFLQKPLFQLLG